MLEWARRREGERGKAIEAKRREPVERDKYRETVDDRRYEKIRET